MKMCANDRILSAALPRVMLAILLVSAFILNPGVAGSAGLSQQQTAKMANLTRPEVTQAAKALGFTMQGKTAAADIAPAVFENPSVAPPVDPVLKRNGFQLVQIATSSHERLKGDPAQRFAGGVLIHRDPAGRFAISSYAVQFRVGKGGKVTLQNAVVKPIDSPIPRVYSYYVPASAVPRSLLEGGSFTKLLQRVTGNAVSVAGGRRVDRSVKDYLVFSFLMDRVSSDAKLGLASITETEKKAAASGGGSKAGSSVGSFSFDMKKSMMGAADSTAKAAGSRSFQTDGWHVAWMPARFAVDGKDVVAFKVLYTPGRNAPRGQRHQLLADVITSNISDARVAFVARVQEALADRGYNPGPANGVVSKATGNAIRKFQQDSKLAVDGKPSVGIYRALTGEMPQPIPADPKKLERQRKVAPPPDAVKVMRLQYTLSRVGYYRGPINGEMNRETKDAMARFERKTAKRTTAAKKPAPVKKKSVAVAKPAARKKAAGARTVAPKKKAVKRKATAGAAVRFDAIVRAYPGKAWPNRVEQPAKPEMSEGFTVFPTPVLYVVPSEAVRGRKLPGKYFDLMRFAAEQAVDVQSASPEKREYVVFAFLKQKTSSSSKLRLKISDSKSGTGGYKKASKSLDFYGRKAAYLAGKLKLNDSSTKSKLYFKTVFTPGDEVGFFSRSARKVGQFASDGS